MSASLTLDKFPFSQVAAWLQDGDVIPFVGAGSSACGLPDGHELPDGRGLAEELATLMGEAFPADELPDLPKVAQFFQNTFLDRAALYDHLYRRFEADQQQRTPGPVAQMLATAPRANKPLFLITTNYDSHIERAFRAAGRDLCVITQNMRDPANGAAAISLALPDGTLATDRSAEFQWNDPQRFEPGCAYLFKIHGSVLRKVPQEPDDVIITEDDYVDFLANSGGTVSPFFPPASLAAAYKARRFLFLGYSLRDWNFRAFLRILALRNALSGREVRRHWAVQRAPAPLEVDLWSHRNVNVYDGDLADFVSRLSKEWGEQGMEQP